MTDTEFHIQDRSAGPGTHVVAVAGEIDLFTAPEFKEHVAGPIDRGCRRLVVDLSATTFIDSSSLGVLIGAHRRLERSGGAMIVVVIDEAILKTFRITGLDGVFTIVSTLQEALDPDAVGSG